MFVLLLLLSFFAEYIDSTLGMGFGTIISPVLLSLNQDPQVIVSGILFSEFISGMGVTLAHQKFGNINFKPKTVKVSELKKQRKENGLLHTTKHNLTRETKIALLLASCSVLGTVIAVFISVNISEMALKLAISGIIILIGLFILVNRNRKHNFSWKKLTLLGITASFNKGLSGGGYGPLVTGGQVLIGVDEKQSIAITSLAEGLTSAVALVLYLVLGGRFDINLALILLAGSVISIPFAGHTVKKMRVKQLKTFIGIMTLILGLLSLYKSLNYS